MTGWKFAITCLALFALWDPCYSQSQSQPASATMTPTLYVVGYSHLDTQWLWTYRQTIEEYLPRTLDDNFALLDKYPHYIFNFSGANRYRMIQEYYPQQFERLKRYVAAGRWFPAGSSWEECDVLAPSSESILRQVLYGNEFFRRQLGRESREFLLPDAFGFPASLPSVLAHCGLIGFSTQKLSWGSAVGIPFNVGLWQGPDGQSVIAALNPGPYDKTIDEDLRSSPAWVKRLADDARAANLPVDYLYYGVGDRGGAPAQTSVANVEKSLAPGGPVKVLSANAQQMFGDLLGWPGLESLPHYSGDLLLVQHSTGTLTSQAALKRWNRANELLADQAERLSVAAAWLGAAYPMDKLTAAWQLVLGAQFHDILPGTSVPECYEPAWNDELLAMNQFSAVATGAVADISAAMDTRGQGASFLIFNPLSIERRELVEVTVPFVAPGVDITGPNEDFGRWSIVSRDKDHMRVALVANVPPLGFAAYNIAPSLQAPDERGPEGAAGPETRPDDQGPGERRFGERRFGREGRPWGFGGFGPGRHGRRRFLASGDNWIQNFHYRVSVNKDGDVDSIQDSFTGAEILSAPMRLALQPELPQTKPAWRMYWDDRQKPAEYVAGPAEIRVIQDGNARVAIRVTRRTKGSTFVQTVSLRPYSERVDFDLDVDWKTQGCSLRAAFPLSISSPTVTSNWGPGVVERPNNSPTLYEMPVHQWLDLLSAKANYGVAILTGAKYAFDKPSDSTLRLTLLYTPGIRNDYPAAAWPERWAEMGTQDLGSHHIHFGLVGHSGDWRDAKIPWQADMMEQPLLAFAVPAHEGSLGRSFSLLLVNPDQVAIRALKKAQDSDEIIVRLQEITGKVCKLATVSSPTSILSAREVTGQEQPFGQACLDKGILQAYFPPYRTRTFALRIAPPQAAIKPPHCRPLPLPFNADGISPDSAKTDGDFDGAGRSLPAEQLPRVVISEGIRFKIGPVDTGAQNVLLCRGQTLPLPEGNFNRLYLLAAATDDTLGTFALGNVRANLSIQSWQGYIGQWDRRVWANPPAIAKGQPPRQLLRIEPGYLKPDTVAWFCSHRHLPDGKNDTYAYSYLFKYRLDLPADARTLTLPDNDKIRILAVTAVQETADAVRPLQPLGDTLPAPSTQPAK